MKEPPVLILDGNYLCHRAHYAMNKNQRMEYKGKPTGIIFGFLRELLGLKDRFQTDEIIVCFDHGTSFRAEMLPSYKSSRKLVQQKNAKDPEERQRQEDLYKQIEMLKINVLQMLGLRNVFYYDTFEADDFIAYLCKHKMLGERRIIIVSADKDLLQLLNKRISIYVPGKDKPYTREMLEKEFHIPTDGSNYWWKVKAIAGCSTDDIPGIKGVGDITAAKYFANLLNMESPTAKSIAKQVPSMLKRNEGLVKLPHPRVISVLSENPIRLQKSKWTHEGWSSVIEMFGLTSLSAKIGGLPIIAKGVKPRKEPSDGKRKK